MMKRVALILILALVVVFGLCLLLPVSSPIIPRFVPGKTQPTGSYTVTHYDWGGTRPFVGDKVWVFGARNGTNRFTCLYDLRERMILGELQNGGVILVNADGTKLLVQGAGTPAANLKTWFLAWLKRVTNGKVAPGGNRTDYFWILDLKDNSARRVGSVSQFAGTGSHWYTSPGLRYGCTMPTTDLRRSCALFDFETGQFERVAVNGEPRGWWDDQHVLLQDNNNEFILYDVSHKQISALFNMDTLRATLAQLKPPGDPNNVVTFANWNGKDYDFYFTERDYEFKAKRCYLLKADRSTPQPTLKLLFPEFKFEWGGRLDARGTRFVYQGESGAVGAGGNGAVYLRDLSDNSLRTLVPPDNKGQYAIPRFYGDEVIYYHNRLLWRVGLDGSNNVPLFPTTNSPAKL